METGLSMMHQLRPRSIADLFDDIQHRLHHLVGGSYGFGVCLVGLLDRNQLGQLIPQVHIALLEAIGGDRVAAEIGSIIDHCRS